MSLPPHYTSKVLAALVHAGVLRGVRGHHGGYTLARDAAEISLRTIVEPFERERLSPSCILGEQVCSDSAACAVHRRWSVVQSTYLEFLEQTTLADIARGS